MTERYHKNEESKVKKVILWVLAVFAVLLAAGFILMEYRWKPFVKAKLEDAVLKGSDSLYHLKIGSISANIFTGNVALANAELLPDTQVYQRFVALKKAPNKIFHMRVNALKISHLSILTAFFDHRLNVDSVIIAEPDFTVISKKQPYNHTRKKPKTLYQLTKSVFSEIKINGIAINNVNFVYVDNNHEKSRNTSLKNLNIRINKFLIDSTSAKDTTRFLSSKSLEFRLPGYQMVTEDSLYYLKVKDVYFSTKKSQLIVKNLAFSPRYDKAGFYKKVKVQKDRYDLNFGLITLNQLDLDRFDNQYQLFSGSAKISNAQVSIFTNNAYPKEKDQKPKRNNFPQQQLQQLATTLKIDTLFLDDVNVSYGEANASSGRTGTVAFNKIEGKILNVTNDSVAKKK